MVTHTHTHKLTTVPSAHAGEGNKPAFEITMTVYHMGTLKNGKTFDTHLRSTGGDTTRDGGTTGGDTTRDGGTTGGDTPDTIEGSIKVETEVESNHNNHCMAIDVHN